MLRDSGIRTGQIEVMRHMGHRSCDIKSNFLFAQPARRKLLAANGYHFVLRTMRFMYGGVDAGCRYNLPRLISLWFAVVGKLHNLICAFDLARYAQENPTPTSYRARNPGRSLQFSLTRSTDGLPRWPCYPDPIL